MELAKVEARPIAGRDLAAQRLDLALAELVGQGLARPADVAVGLDQRIRFGQAGIVAEEIDRALTLPAQSVQAGIHDQPGGAPGLPVEHPEALGLGAVQPHLVRQPLAVQPPALDVRPTDHPRPEPAERAEMLILHLQGDLEMVPGSRLVVRRRSELGVLARRQVVTVGVIDAVARPVGGRRVVVGEGCVTLLVLLDRPDIQAGSRQSTEVAWCQGHRPLDVLARSRHELVLGPGRVGRICVERRAVGGGVVPEPFRTRDLAPLCLDRFELRQTDLVDLERLHIERGPAADRGPVDLLPVGCRPDARLLAAGVAVLATQCVEESGIGREDDIAHDLADPLAVPIGGAPNARRDDGVRDRDGEHPLHLRDGPLGHDRWRRQSAAQPLAQDGHIGLHERRIRVEPGDERLEPLGRVDRLERGHLWQQLLRPAHLVDDAELVQTLVILLDGEFADDLQHVARDALLGGQAIERDRGGLAGRTLHQLARPGAAVGRGILESIGVARVTVERGGRRVELQDALPETIGQGVHGGSIVGHRCWASPVFSWHPGRATAARVGPSA